MVMARSSQDRERSRIYFRGYVSQEARASLALYWDTLNVPRMPEIVRAEWLRVKCQISDCREMIANLPISFGKTRDLPTRGEIIKSGPNACWSRR